MGTVEERVAEVEQVFDTRLGPNEIYAAIQRSAVAAKVAAGGGKLKELARQEQQDGSDAVYFAVLMGIGVEHGRIAVRWWPDRPGWHCAKVHVISYDTSQVAPLAPKTVPILRCVRRFVTALEVELRVTALEVALRKGPAKGPATRTETSTQTASVAGEPTDEEIDHLVELAERGMSGGTLSDAELRELEAAGITAVHEPGRGDEDKEELSAAPGGNPSIAEARRRLVEEGVIDEPVEGSAEGASEETETAADADAQLASTVSSHHSGAEDAEFCTQCGTPLQGHWQFCGACGASTTRVGLHTPPPAPRPTVDPS